MLTLHSTLCAVNSSTPGAVYVAKCGRHEMQLKYRMVAVTSVTFLYINLGKYTGVLLVDNEKYM